jgi:cytochrome c55X
MRSAPSIWRWSSGLAIACGLLGAPAAAAESAANAERLSRLVLQDCGSCHGLTLRGGLGKPLTADALAQWNREQLAHIILNGVPGTPMPGWRPLMTESEAYWIADLLKQGRLQ